MVRADLLPFPSFTVAPATGVVAAARGDWAASAYNPLAQEVARDVQQFIQQGGGVGSASAMASAQAQWMAHQAAQQLKEQDKKTSASSAGAVATTGSQAAKTPGAAKAGTLKPEQQAFLQQIGPWAERAAQQLGVSARSIMAHAALESAWGQQPLRTANGGNSWNLFGLKTGSSWQGASLTALTTEYEDGTANKQRQSFRQYENLGDSFADYVQLLGRSPRYRQALHTGNDVQAFAQALAQGGYATDPDYASKLVAVSRLIAP